MNIKMNKNEFIEELLQRLNYSKEEVSKINSILEKNFFISKKSKEKIINELISTLNISFEEANRIYDTARSLLKEEVDKNLKQTFKGND